MEESSGRRVFAEGETAASLLEKIDNLTDAQAESIVGQNEGKWLSARGLVINVSSKTGRTGPTVSLDMGGFRSVFCMFNEDDERPLDLHMGDAATVQGRIHSLRFRTIWLENCEVLQVTSKAEIEARLASQKVAREEPQAPTAESTPDKPRLPDAALDAWCKAFKIAYPNGSQILAEKSAAGAFPNHHVARKRVRELFPNPPLGRPKKNNDLDN